MNISIESMPLFCIIWITVGVIIIVYAILRLAGHEEKVAVNANNQTDGEKNSQLEELFSYFLEEEEKKNQDFRNLIMDVTKTQKQRYKLPMNETNVNKSSHANEKLYQDIIKQFEAGDDVETIAKKMKKGVGEVKLIISLYNMR